MEILTTKIAASEGLHARPAQQFCSMASKFSSSIKIRNLTSDSKPVNAKSILLVLTLGVEHGHEVEICADGEDETQSILALQNLLESWAST